MLPIYICEDEPALLELYTSYIQNYISFHRYEMKVVCSTISSDEVLESVRSSRQKGVYFLDIELGKGKEHDGIYLGQKIREYDSEGYIVYITSHSELSIMVLRYHVNATDFIPKDETKELKQNIANALNHIHELDMKYLPEEKVLVLNTKTDIIHLKQSDIYYIEAIQGTHKTAIHTQAGLYEIGESLSSIFARLTDDFVYSHKAFIVNVQHIKVFLKKERRIIFDNDTSCEVSVRYARNVASCFNPPK